MLKAQRADLEQALARRDAENQQLPETIDRLESTIARMTRTNANLADKIAELTTEVAALRRQLSRALGNAPETPSGQIPVFLKLPRAKTGHRPGRKRGHPGAARERPEPDRAEHHELTQCPHCDGPVRPVRDAGAEPVVRFR